MDNKIIRNKERNIYEALIPVFALVGMLAYNVFVYGDDGNKYLDLYGGHAVISIGHSHPQYVNSIKNQIEKIGFYSNSVQNPLQNKLSEKLNEISGCKDYQLFLCNSGAEANENAIKLASFHNKKLISQAYDNMTGKAKCCVLCCNGI